MRSCLRQPEGQAADVAFECGGVNAMLNTVLEAVRPGAVVVAVEQSLAVFLGLARYLG